MLIPRLLLLSLAILSLSACGSYKMYKEDVVTGPSANLTLEIGADTFFSRYVYAKLYDYRKIESGEACKTKGILNKDTVISNDAFYGMMYAGSKKPSEAKRIPANIPIRAYLEFADHAGNTTFVNYADIVFVPKKGKSYKFGYKRASNSNGDFYLLEKTRSGYKKLSNYAAFDYGVCDKYLN